MSDTQMMANRLAKLLALAFALASPGAFAAEEGVFEQLAKSPIWQDAYVQRRTPTGIDVNSKEEIELNGRKHSRFHFEIEGPLPVPNVKSLPEAIDLVAHLVAEEIDASHREQNTARPGLGVDIVKVNGAEVGFLQYRSAREPDTFLRRAVIFTKGQLYTATMSLHSVPENDRHGLLLPALVIEMLKSKEVNPPPP